MANSALNVLSSNDSMDSSCLGGARFGVAGAGAGDGDGDATLVRVAFDEAGVILIFFPCSGASDPSSFCRVVSNCGEFDVCCGELLVGDSDGDAADGVVACAVNFANLLLRI